MFEEPPISGSLGSGTIFFGGCNLRCVFCQNKAISACPEGKEYDKDALAELFIKVGESGVHNINLVTPTPHLHVIIPALEKAKGHLRVPVVYNTSSYETEEVTDALLPLVDIWLPDLKYRSDELSCRYSGAPRYFNTAMKNIEKMLASAPHFSLTEDGILTSGVIIRHLVLPSHREDSLAVVDSLLPMKEKYDFRISLMSQYTPDFLGTDRRNHPEIGRRVTSLEYKRVIERALALGFCGYFQGRESAETKYTPLFDAKKFRESDIIEI